jgi:hypothetical protein
MGDESANGPSPIRTSIVNAAFSRQSEFFRHAITRVNPTSLQFSGAYGDSGLPRPASRRRLELERAVSRGAP